MNIQNKYVICSTPTDDDSVWDYVVDRNHVRHSLDASKVVLKWPVEGSPHWAMIKRLGGIRYTHAEVLVVLAGPEWTPPNEDAP